MSGAPEQRVILVRPRTILIVLAVTLLVLGALYVVYLAFHVITWILIAAFLAAALNPAVELFERHGIRRGRGALLVFFLAVLVLAGMGFLLIPPLVDQVRGFVDALPGFVDDLTKGRGRLGFLERNYHVVERVRNAIEQRGAGGLFGLTAPAVGVLKGVVSGVVGAVTVAFLTLFMLLQGPRTVESFFSLLPESAQPRWRRVGREMYRTVGGYVTGNLLISLIAGVAAAVMLVAVGSKYAIALGLIVAIFDLIPLAGATIGAIIVTLVVFVETDWIRGVIAIAFFVVYQQVENHILQPLIYGRTVQLSPLAVLIAVLIGAELAGVLGALAAIPIAASLLAIGRELLLYRREAMIETPAGALAESEPPD